MDQAALDAKLESTVAELQSISDWLHRQRDRVASLAEPFLGTERDDVVGALHEAERQISLANRAVDRAVRAINQPV